MSHTTNAPATTATTTAAPEKVLLSPPWWTLQAKMLHTVGTASNVRVDRLVENPTGYTLPVVTGEPGTGTALATLLTPIFPMGNVIVKVSVQNIDGRPWEARVISTVDELAGAVKDAFYANPLFAGVLVGSNFPGAYTQVVAVFRPAVVQFYNDDLSDYYRNFNGVAAKVFDELLRDEFGSMLRLATTTQDQRAE